VSVPEVYELKLSRMVGYLLDVYVLWLWDRPMNSWLVVFFEREREREDLDT
jgi:hypothetical protein